MSWRRGAGAVRTGTLAHHRSGRAAGFVLLEAVVALAIIALFAVALLGTVGAQVRTADKANVLMTASSLAENRLAALRVLTYDQLNAPPDSLLGGVFPPPFQEYAWTAIVEPVEDEYDLFALDVSVMAFNEVFPLRTLLHRGRPVLQAQADGAGGRGGAGRRGGRGGDSARGGGRGGRGGDGARGGGGRGGRGGARGGGGRGGGGRGGRGGGGRGGGGGGGGGENAPGLDLTLGWAP